MKIDEFKIADLAHEYAEKLPSQFNTFNCLIAEAAFFEGFQKALQLVEEAIEEVKKEKKKAKKEKADDIKNRITKAAELLQRNNVEFVVLGRFGIYYQYEMAGEKVSFNLLDGCEEFGENEDAVDELYEHLSFLEENRQYYIHEVLNFPEERQNKLIFNNEGKFSYQPFTI